MKRNRRPSTRFWPIPAPESLYNTWSINRSTWNPTSGSGITHVQPGNLATTGDTVSERQAITLYGDGKQVRDILHVDDLIRAFLLAQGTVGDLSGQAFNIGGGAANTTSLLQLTQLIAELRGERLKVIFAGGRPAD